MSIYKPVQTVLITCRGVVKNKFSSKEEVKDNIITLDWHTRVSSEPFLYIISVGKTRFSCNIIKNSKVFVVNFMPYELKKEVLFCGRNSGEHVDKFKESGLTKEESEKLDCCRIKQAAAYLECEVINEIEAGDHIIFIGKVINSHEEEEKKRLFHIEEDNFTTTK